MSEGSGVKEETARTEILAKAFKKVSEDYFRRWAGYEEVIEEAEGTKKKMWNWGALGMVAGLALSGLLILEYPAMTTLALIPSFAAVVWVGYAYYQYQQAEDKIEENEEKIEENQPDGSVSFVSKIHVPFYLIPYDDDSYIIFDGLDSPPETDIQISNIDGDELEVASEDLTEMKQLYDEYLGDEGIIEPEFAEQVSPNVSEHRVLEYPVVEQIDRMTEVASDFDVEEIEVNVHANSVKSRSVKSLLDLGNTEPADNHNTVKTRRSIEECEETIKNIKGVEKQAVSGDLLSRSKEHREKVIEICEDLERRLEKNGEILHEHYDWLSTEAPEFAKRKVCEECFESTKSEVEDELNLVNEVLGTETGSFGAALNDEDIDQIDADFRSRIRQDISKELPQIEGKLLESHNDLKNLSNGTCEKHDSVGKVHVSDAGGLFGTVWESMYYSYREPVLDKAEDLEKDAEQTRENKEKKMIDISQYEQMKDSYEREKEMTKSEYEAAREAEKELKNLSRGR